MGKDETKNTKKIRLGSVTIESERRDKVFFPDSGITKAELVDYYHMIADVMLPHVRDRAVSMHRFPDGIEEEGFFHKDAPDYFPGWVTTETLENRQRGSTTYVVIDKTATLVYLADQGTITPHVWLSRINRPERPDRLIFDLDPPDDEFGPTRSAARVIRETLEDVDVASFVMTTGSRGLHVVVPLDRDSDFEEARAFAADVAELAALRHPDELTVEQRKKKRKGRLFLDVMRNAYGQTGVPPYSVRARPGAPVAAPIEWDELGSADMRSNRYNIRSIFRRLGQRDDPWKGIGRHAVGLNEKSKKLQSLLEEERGSGE
ncbi:MAG: ATP-dependent DNA ligase [Candidatus Eisenbacteria bacterium]|nr:ATP-dependent DNA ligase [Candidatus Eisenbacteria bacterium]